MEQPPRRAGRFRRALRVLVGSLVLAGCAVLYAWRVEPYWIERVEVEIPVRGLDPALDGYRIVQLSDFHLGAWLDEDDLAGAIEAANDLDPDLVVMTGDLAERGEHGRAGRVLGRLRAREGILACHGNDEIHAEMRGDLPGLLAPHGVRVLDNASALVGAGRLAVVGYTYGHYDIVRATAGIPEGVPTILLAHSPDFLEALAAQSGPRFDLMLCGHTHGGQIRLPFVGPVHAHNDRQRRNNAGLYETSFGPLYVNRGVGLAKFPMRFLCRPEVTLLVLRRERE